MAVGYLGCVLPWWLGLPSKGVVVVASEGGGGNQGGSRGGGGAMSGRQDRHRQVGT